MTTAANLKQRASSTITGSLSVVTAASGDVVTPEEMFAFLRLSENQAEAQYEFVKSLLDTAIEVLEVSLQRKYLTETFDYFLDTFPHGGREHIYLPRNPVSSVTSVKYYDENDTQQTWTSTNYNVDTASEPARIEPDVAVVWPATYDMVNAVEVRFVAGYGDKDDVPDAAKYLIKALVSHWFMDMDSIGVIPMHLRGLVMNNSYTGNIG